MAFGTSGKNPHHKRLPRDARHLVRQMLRPGLSPWRRAVVLHAQVAALDFAVSRKHRRGITPPAEVPGSIADGQRVRIGVEVRDLLIRLHASKNVREQQALMREIRHAVLRRILLHVRRSRAVQGTRRLAARGGHLVRRLTVSGWRWVRTRHQGRQVRVVGNRKPVERTRQSGQHRASRALPDGERTRPAVRYAREPVSRTRTKA